MRNTKDLKQTFSSIQNTLLPGVILDNIFQIEEIRLIAGVDVAYWDENKATYGVCSIVIIDYHTKEVIEQVYSVGEITIPYIAGFLAFRELPLVMDAVNKLMIQPDLYLFDGNGYLHERHMGIATHASFYLNRPTIGVAKSYLKIGNVDFVVPENITGAYTDIIIEGKVYGRALRSRLRVKPIFISCGNLIDMDTATEIVMSLIGKNSRIPIPLRLAHLTTNQMRKKLIEQWVHLFS
ncbi:endonuclease V [Pseudogracilibacillus auburnensis]|uniref:endonuclease V n=1 Tax=Pseudogracilibacillus auburnensis TaxID=1494959 RepID=UPI001A973BD8|nr:endonuclease V [Pseudogracilibacillus auburnensis]MBO1005689.1 endonuclease V [Pseudogracilibacillus auburnensis]